jgi:hypothetical protein
MMLVGIEYWKDRALRAELCNSRMDENNLALLVERRRLETQIQQAQAALAEALERLGPVHEKHRETIRGKAQAKVAEAAMLLDQALQEKRND